VPTKPTNSLTGLWELVSVDVEYQDTDETKQPYGTRPNGYLVLLPQGRMMALITAEGRKEPLTEEERSAALRSMLAYSGIYRFEDDKWITRVDVAWNEAWTGTNQIRFFSFDGKHLTVKTPWQPSANEPGRTHRVTLTWQRPVIHEDAAS
jgi:hypothetical protein